MRNKADFRRRLLGAIFLSAALGMLIAGETVLRETLKRPAILLLWVIGIFAFTCLAILMAFLELVVVRHRAREEQRALLENALRDIVREKDVKSRKQPPG
jgi:hypothetical protein